MTDARPVPATARAWTLRRRIGRVFVGMALALVLLATILIVSIVQFGRAGNDVIYRWQPALSASQRLLGDLVNEETGVRGYLLSQRSAALQPYTEYRGVQADDAKRVTDLAGSDGGVADRLAAVLATAREWERQVAEPLIRKVHLGQKAGLADLEAGQQQFDAIRARSADLTRTLRDRTDAARSSRTASGAVAGTALGLSLALIAVAGIVMWRGLHRSVLAPIERLGAQTRLVAAGDRNHEIVPAGPVELTGLALDVEGMRAEIVTQLALAEHRTEELRRQGEELERSNDDLAQFAYVASHDLSEPLRKVANFCQLLERQYGDGLDDRGREYIAFAVDGAKRMQALITDLLALSRVGRATERFVEVELDAALDQGLANISQAIAASDATIERVTPLPTVAGDRSLLTSLLENLVGNAVKYRREGVAPVVRIAAERDPTTSMWTIIVRDNGIGIEPQYGERIFAVFQRLHLRDSYEGTGIGLALCRKIVEFHGGRIWLDPVQSAQDSNGATFKFTLPEGRPGDGPPR